MIPHEHWRHLTLVSLGGGSKEDRRKGQPEGLKICPRCQGDSRIVSEEGTTAGFASGDDPNTYRASFACGECNHHYAWRWNYRARTAELLGNRPSPEACYPRG